MSIAKILKKAFLISALIVITVLLAGSILLYFYQGEIIQKFILEANKQLNAKIEVKEIQTNLFESFPTITIAFNNITVSSTHESELTPLLKADVLRFSLNPIDMINGQYTIEGLSIRNGNCFIYVDKNGDINYNIIKPSKGESKSNIAFELSTIALRQIYFVYRNEYNRSEIKINTDKSTASLTSEGDNIYISANGNYATEKIRIGESDYFQNKVVNLASKVVYNTFNKSLEIRPSNLNVNQSDFLVYGKYQIKDDRNIDLYVESKKSTISSIGSLLPNHFESYLNKYKSTGEIYFDLNLSGPLATAKGPQLNIKFGLINSDLIYPEKNITISNTSAEGYFSLNDINKLNTGLLELSNIKGSFENNPFEGDLAISNFKNSHLKFNFTGSLDVNSLIQFLDFKSIEEASGLLEVDIAFKGKISDLKQRETAKNIETSGQLIIKDLHLKTSYLKLPTDKLNGTLLFDNNDVAIDNLSGVYGSSDFGLKGYLKNLFGYLLLPNEKIGIDAELNSKLIDLDELLSSDEKSNGSYSFKLSPNLLLRFKCSIDKLVFRRFRPSNFSGTILIKDQILNGDAITFKNIGGKVKLNGSVDASDANNLLVNSNVELNNILLDSGFYIFENFRQTFISNQHLKGKIDAKIEASMTFDSLLNLNPQSLKSTISTSIKNGELNDFEPLKRLEKYVEDESLKNLRFSDLETDIVIKNQTIYLPQMEISTNVTSLKLQGTHTFDQHIDYRVITPLNRNRKVDKDEAFGAIEETPGGQSLLFLKIMGTTSNYEVSYDKDAVKNKIASDLKKEVQELKDAFKNKGVKKDSKIELEEDDYFDWDENN